MLKISETATDKIREMLAAEDVANMFLRVGVKEGGCSGFSYGMGFDNEQSETDQMLDVNGLKIIVDEDSSQYLFGVEIDYKDTAMGGGFTIDNPNAVATCGCGSSFRTRTDRGKPADC